MTQHESRGARVTARGWSWRHAGRSRPAVADLDLTIEPGARVLLLGASGAGKSTLLHALAGVLGGDDEDGDTRGELLIDGMPTYAVRGRAGLVLQDPDSQVVLARVGDDVAFACENLGVPRDETWRRVDEALAAVGLDVPKNSPTSTLSGGQKQRLALAGVIAMRPGLILLDEPTANLDPEGVVEVRDAVSRVAASTGATLVVVEHRVAVWSEVVDRVVVLASGGGVLADGPVREVLHDEARELAAAGVWVPGVPPVVPERPAKPAGELLLTARSLTVGRRGPAARDATAVARDLSCDVVGGHSLAVTGPNGAGKSTLGLTLAGLIPPVQGDLVATTALAGQLRSSPHTWRSRDLLTRLGTVFQDPEHQFLTGSVTAELALGAHAAGMAEASVRARVDELVQQLRLDHLADANPFTLSGGEKRRLSVATVLASRPRVVVLDEPTFGQDSRTWAAMVSLLTNLHDDGVASVVVTHDEEFVEAVADSRLALHRREAVLT